MDSLTSLYLTKTILEIKKAYEDTSSFLYLQYLYFKFKNEKKHLLFPLK